MQKKPHKPQTPKKLSKKQPKANPPKKSQNKNGHPTPKNNNPHQPKSTLPDWQEKVSSLVFPSIKSNRFHSSATTAFHQVILKFRHRKKDQRTEDYFTRHTEN